MYLFTSRRQQLKISNWAQNLKVEIIQKMMMMKEKKRKSAECVVFSNRFLFDSHKFCVYISLKKIRLSNGAHCRRGKESKDEK